MGQHFALTFVTFSAVAATKLRAMNSEGVPPPVGVYSFRHGPCQHLVHILLVSWIQIDQKHLWNCKREREMLVVYLIGLSLFFVFFLGPKKQKSIAAQQTFLHCKPCSF